MKYELKHYVEDKPFIDSVLAMMRDHALERLGAQNYNPDVVKILGLWKLGVLRLVTMVDDDDAGVLVGYQGWLCSSQLTNTEVSQATLSYIFVDPKVRGAQDQFSEFVAYGVAAMKILGNKDILAGVDGDQPYVKEMFKKAGFTVERATQLSYTGV